MGGTSFQDEYRGTLSMSEAYRELVDQAIYEHGLNPYSGTIATTSGVVPDPGVSEPLTREQAHRHLFGDPEDPTSKRWWEKDHGPTKWDAAWAIPLKPETEPNPDPLLADPWRQHMDQPGWLFYGIAAC